jgi:NAD-dependent SIR2 family protein deacetylase
MTKTPTNVEIGIQGARFGDFRRCQSCRQGYWVEALSRFHRTEFIQCPICATQQKRKEVTSKPES